MIAFVSAALAADPVTTEAIATLFPATIAGIPRGPVEPLATLGSGGTNSLVATYGDGHSRTVHVFLGPADVTLDAFMPGAQTTSIGGHAAGWSAKTIQGQAEAEAAAIVGSTLVLVVDRPAARSDTALTVLKSLPLDALGAAFPRWVPPPAPANAFGPDAPIILGALDRAQVDVVVAAQRGEILACGGTAKGRVVIKFTVSVEGIVTAAAVKSSTVADDAVGTCAAAVFRKMKFASPKGGGIAIISYPVTFGSGP